MGKVNAVWRKLRRVIRIPLVEQGRGLFASGETPAMRFARRETKRQIYQPGKSGLALRGVPVYSAVRKERAYVIAVSPGSPSGGCRPARRRAVRPLQGNGGAEREST